MTDSLPQAILADPNRGVMRCALHSFYGGLWWLAMGLSSPWWIGRSVYDPSFRRMVRGRLGIDLPRPTASGERQRLLIHGVSVGEVKAAQALVQQLEEACPELEVFISTVTDTGFRIAQDLYGASRVVRFPMEPGLIVRRFLRRVCPVAVVLVELEIWPNFLRAANLAGIPVAVVNGRITTHSYLRYHRFRNLLPQFNRISLYCVQDAQYGERFAALCGQPERILVTGNVKADSLGDGPRDPGVERRRWLAGRPAQPVFTAGSTHEGEELLLVELWRELFPEWRLILVPRHPPRASSIREALLAAGQACQYLSEVRRGASPDPDLPMLVDSIGELEQIYGLSNLVFVGGSLVPHGGQNMLEPAAQGLPVVYGPHVQNFSIEAGLLEAAGAAYRARDVADLGRFLSELLASEERQGEMARAGLEVVRRQKGATRRTLEALLATCLPPWNSEDCAAGPPQGA